MNKLGKYNRSVSIIGVGCTPFMYTVDHPETNGLTEGEMFGYAALKAMEDAGLLFPRTGQSAEWFKLPDTKRTDCKLVRHEGKGFDTSFRGLLYWLPCSRTGS